MKLILASSNPHKIRKLLWIYDKYFDEIQPQNKQLDINEDGKTFQENAEKKAIEVSRIYDTYATATDGGVLIPALGDNWNGLFTKRFINKDNATDFDRMDALLDLMKNIQGEDRAITWNEAIAIAYKGKLLFSRQVEGDRGLIQTSYNPSQYQEGIWQCTLTCYPQFNNKNFFELNEEERKYSEISWYRLKSAVSDYLNAIKLS